jgi:hypothetical protein
MSRRPAPNAKFESPVPIIGSKYCVPYEVNLAIVKDIVNITHGNFDVKDVEGHDIYKVDQKLASLHGRRVLSDGAGNPVITIRDKVWTISPTINVHDIMCPILLAEIGIISRNFIRREPLTYILIFMS